MPVTHRLVCLNSQLCSSKPRLIIRITVTSRYSTLGLFPCCYAGREKISIAAFTRHQLFVYGEKHRSLRLNKTTARVRRHQFLMSLLKFKRFLNLTCFYIDLALAYVGTCIGTLARCTICCYNFLFLRCNQ